jgi:hypothetical protein
VTECLSEVPHIDASNKEISNILTYFLWMATKDGAFTNLLTLTLNNGLRRGVFSLPMRLGPRLPLSVWSGHGKGFWEVSARKTGL